VNSGLAFALPNPFREIAMQHRHVVALFALAALLAFASAGRAEEVKVKGKIDKIDRTDGTVLILKVDDKNAEKRFHVLKTTKVFNDRGDEITAKDLKEGDKVTVTSEVTEKEGKKTRKTKEVRVIKP
jgi:hypothetical protein